MKRLVEKARSLTDPASPEAMTARVTTLERQIAEERAKVASEKARHGFLTSIIEEQQNRIERIESGLFKFPKQKPGKTPSTFLRVCLPDTHGCCVAPAAISAFLADLESLKPHEIIMLGDHVDCGGFLAQNHTMGYVAQTSYTYEDDLSAANQLLDEMQKICPSARIEYLEGNHEFRVSRYCVTQALRNGQDANFLLKLLSVKNQLRLKDRGIPYYQQGQFYDDCPIPATIKRGKCHFTHGSRTGSNAARSMLHDFGGNVVFGHVHRAMSFVAQTVKGGQVGAWCPGFLGKLQPYWMHTQITGWAHGYGLQIVEETSGDFLHLNVPIIDGKSLLFSLTKRLR